MIDNVMQYIGQLVVYGGGAVAIGFGLFKAFGTKWLEAQFAERLQNLKVEHDKQLKHVQSTIDREIHRARALYDREFETLSEAWRLFCTSYNNGIATAVDSYPNLARYSLDELTDLLSTTSMREYEKADMLAMYADSWTEHFRRWSNLQRIKSYWSDRKLFTDYLNANAIFWPKGIKENFLVLDGLVGVAIAEMEQRLRSPNFQSFDQVSKLLKDGNSLKVELEEMIQSRLWSSDLVKNCQIGSV